MEMRVTEEHEAMINDCEKRINKLTAWEIDYIADIKGNMFLTMNQIQKLEEIWERIT